MNLERAQAIQKARTPPPRRGGALTAAITGADRSIIRFLTDRDAFSADRAIGYMPPRHIHRLRLSVLEGAGLIREAAPGRYYLDPGRLEQREARERRVLLTLALGLGGASTISLIAGLLGWLS